MSEGNGQIDTSFEIWSNSSIVQRECKVKQAFKNESNTGTCRLREYYSFYRKYYLIKQFITIVMPIQAQSAPYLTFWSIMISLIDHMILVAMETILMRNYVLPQLPKWVYY